MNPITVKLTALKIFIIISILLLVIFLLKVYFSSDEDDEISYVKDFYSENQQSNKFKQSLDGNSLEKILAPILAASDDQLLIDPKVILTTIRFMLEERDEDDPELIEFVRSLIVRPDPEKKLVLKDKNKYNSSHTTSSRYVHETLKGKRDGFFIEAGAHEGEDISNTLFFEMERGWTGILIEPVPSFYKELLGKNRNAFALNACIANRKPLVSKFRIHFSLSGRLSEMHQKHGARMDKESGTKAHKVGYFPCFSLVTIMKALGVSHVDYFSLDVEGGEIDVLKAIDFKQLDIKMFSVEHNGFNENKEAINEFMTSKGYSVTKVDAQDGYYLKP